MRVTSQEKALRMTPRCALTTALALVTNGIESAQRWGGGIAGGAVGRSQAFLDLIETGQVEVQAVARCDAEFACSPCTCALTMSRMLTRRAVAAADWADAVAKAV